MEDNQFNTTEDNGKFDLMGTDEEYRTRRFKKKKHGIAGFFSRLGTSIGDWWQGLKKWQKITLSTVTSILSVILILAIVFFSVFGYNYNNITSNPDDLGFHDVIDKKVINIALFGIDTRSTKSFKGNSDSIMILSINTETKTVKIVSIMRDSLVAIEKNGKTSYKKINSAYATGGPELAIKTINKNFGLDISEYATVNFFGMAEIIDAVGGIDAELTKQEVSTTSKDGFNGLVERHCKTVGVNPKSHYIKTAGKHHLNGIQAVAYSRIRKYVNIWGTNNDFGRTDRQRYVMEQLFNKALTLEKSKYVKLVKALIPYAETSLSYSEIMSLAASVLLKSPTFEQSRMPLSEYQMKSPNIPSEGSVVYYDLEFAKSLLHAFFYEDITPEEYVEANGIGKNDWYGQIKGNVSGSQKPSQNPSSNTTSTDETNTPPTNEISSESVESSDLSSSSPDLSSSQEMTSSESLPSEEESSGNQSESTNSTDPTVSSQPETQTPSTPTTSEQAPTTSESGTTSENTTP